MADIQSNIIQSLTKVIESTQSGYAPHGLGSRAQASSQTNALVLTVVASRDNTVVLQEQSSGKRITLERQAIQALSSNSANAPQLQTGDKLTLLSSTTQYATFHLEKAKAQLGQTPASLGNNYSQSLAQKLSAQWPDISPSTLRKVTPNIINYLNVDGGSALANSTVNGLIEIANKSKLPALAIKLEASVKQLLANTAQLSIAGSLGNKPLNLQIPLTSELSNKLSLGAKLTLTINANDLTKAIRNITLSNQESISHASVKEINQALAIKTDSLKNFLSQVLFSAKNTQSSELVFVPSKENLKTLAQPVKQVLSANLGASANKDAQLVVAQHVNKSSTGEPNIQLSVVAKPALINIDAEQLASGKIDKLQNSLSKASSSMASSVNPLANSLTQVDLSQTALNKNDVATDKASSTRLNSDLQAISTDSLRTQLQTVLSHSLDKQQGLSKEQLSLSGTNQRISIANIEHLSQTIKTELNQALPKADSMSKTLPALFTQLSAMHNQASGELKQVLQALLNQISNTPPNDNDKLSSDELLGQLSAQKIKQTFNQEALPNVTGNINTQALFNLTNASAAISGNLLTGLITMLQVSLQARLAAQQPNLLARFAANTTSTTNANSKASRSNLLNGKTLQDLNKLDPRSSLIGEINKVLSNHSLHKLSAAEASLQGQDSFYYALPNPFSSQHKDIEILIKREKQTAQQGEQKQNQQRWQLSMKLDVGDNGDVLAKIKLINNQLDLNLYASDQALKDKVINFLPYLNKRLVAAGLQIKPNCYVGKIPDTLYKTDFQVVQAYV